MSREGNEAQATKRKSDMEQRQELAKKRAEDTQERKRLLETIDTMMADLVFEDKATDVVDAVAAWLEEHKDSPLEGLREQFAILSKAQSSRGSQDAMCSCVKIFLRCISGTPKFAFYSRCFTGMEVVRMVVSC